MINICVTLMPTDTKDAMRQMAALRESADLFEIRLDAMTEFNLPALLANRPKPVIITNRAANEGGRKSQDQLSRLASLAEAARLGADYIDVEMASLAEFQRLAPDLVATQPDQGASWTSPRTKLIVSYHNLTEMPTDLSAIAGRIAATSADIVKVVGTARDPLDNLPVFAALRDAVKPTIALAMGEHGQMSRLLAGKFGAYLTFAASGLGDAGAAGQITVDQMRRLYRADRIGPATRVYAVMGNPVEHSLSPAIHNAAFAATGLDAIYLRLKVEGDPAEVVRQLAAVPVNGYSVTIPHKEAVMAACAEIDPLARRMRAVNTLSWRRGSYYATNTDVTSAMKVLAAAVGSERFHGKRALVIGAGGVGRAYVHGLVSRGAKVFVTDVDAARAEAVAAETGAEAVAHDEVGRREVDILMNATPIGMWPKVEATPLDSRWLRAGMVVFDAVYNPQETRLLREAGRIGGRTVSGVEQFVGQAVEQFELWTGQPAPAELMRRVVVETLGR